MSAGEEKANRTQRGAGTYRKLAAVVASIVVLALAAAVVIEAIALSDGEPALAASQPASGVDAGPAEATPLDKNTWLVSGELGKDGLFICENGFRSVTPYGNDLIVICLK